MTVAPITVARGTLVGNLEVFASILLVAYGVGGLLWLWWMVWRVEPVILKRARECDAAGDVTGSAHQYAVRGFFNAELNTLRILWPPHWWGCYFFWKGVTR